MDFAYDATMQAVRATNKGVRGFLPAVARDTPVNLTAALVVVPATRRSR
jgi:hypothetical protein